MSEKNTLCMRMDLDGMLCSKTLDHESNHCFDLPPTVTPKSVDTEYECAKCGQSVFLEDFEKPGHGLCWTCSSEEVTSLRARLELAMNVVEAAREYCASDLEIKTGDGVFDADVTRTCFNASYVKLITELRALSSLSPEK